MRESVYDGKVEEKTDMGTWASLKSHAATLTAAKAKLVTHDTKVAAFDQEITDIRDAMNLEQSGTGDAAVTKLEDTVEMKAKRKTMSDARIAITTRITQQTDSLNGSNALVQNSAWDVDSKADAQAFRDANI